MTLRSLYLGGIEGRVGEDLDPGVAADPEHLGVEPRLAEGPGVLRGVAARPVDEEEAVAEGVLEAAGAVRAFLTRPRGTGRDRPAFVAALEIDASRLGHAASFDLGTVELDRYGLPRLSCDGRGGRPARIPAGLGLSLDRLDIDRQPLDVLRRPLERLPRLVPLDRDLAVLEGLRLGQDLDPARCATRCRDRR